VSEESAGTGIRITVYGETNVGLLREHNEDCFLITDISRAQSLSAAEAPTEITVGAEGVLFFVCDGMGGAAAGEVASHMAVDSVSGALMASEPLPRDAFARKLRRAIEDANAKIYTQAHVNQSQRGMGTTLTAATLVDDTLIVAQVGDSRCYVLRGNRLVQVTHDQSLAWQLIQAGAMTEEEAKHFEHANVILQALGVQEQVEAVLSQVALRRGDVILVSSDGLHGCVTNSEILQILQSHPDVKQASQALIARALERDGPDNVTIIVARCDGPGLPEPTEADVVSYVAYDPGRNPNDPAPATPMAPAAQAPQDTAAPLPASFPRYDAAPMPASETRSLLTFIFVILVAALAGALFLRYERNRALDEHEGSPPVGQTVLERSDQTS
jgi:protein phosphatase